MAISQKKSLSQVCYLFERSLLLSFVFDATSIRIFNWNGHFLSIFGMFIKCFPVILNEFSLIRSLIQLNFAAGYGLAVMLWVQFFFVCELGERADVILDAFKISTFVVELLTEVYFHFILLSNIPIRTTDYQTHFIIVDGTFYQQIIRMTWCFLFKANRMELRWSSDHSVLLTVNYSKWYVSYSSWIFTFQYVRPKWSRSGIKRIKSDSKDPLTYFQITHKIFSFVMFLLNFGS